MSSLGEMLRQARETAGYSINDVANITKIRDVYIAKLEKEELTGLPPEVYTKGFLKNMSKLYQIDGNSVVDAYLALFQTAENKTKGNTQKEKTQEKTRAQNVKNKEKKIQPVLAEEAGIFPKLSLSKETSSPNWIVVIVVTLVLLVALYVGFNKLGNDEVADEPAIIAEEQDSLEPVDPIPGEDSELGEPDVVADEIDVSSEYDYRYLSPVVFDDGLDVMLHVSERAGSRCWVSIEVDGQIEFTETLNAGDIVRFFAQDSLRLTLGDAGVIRIYEDGQDIGFTANAGEVVYKDFIKE